MGPAGRVAARAPPGARHPRPRLLGLLAPRVRRLRPARRSARARCRRPPRRDVVQPGDGGSAGWSASTIPTRSVRGRTRRSTRCLAFSDLPGTPLHLSVGTLADGVAVTRCGPDHTPVAAGRAVDLVGGSHRAAGPRDRDGGASAPPSPRRCSARRWSSDARRRPPRRPAPSVSRRIACPPRRSTAGGATVGARARHRLGGRRSRYWSRLGSVARAGGRRRRPSARRHRLRPGGEPDPGHRQLGARPVVHLHRRVRHHRLRRHARLPRRADPEGGRRHRDPGADARRRRHGPRDDPQLPRRRVRATASTCGTPGSTRCPPATSTTTTSTTCNVLDSILTGSRGVGALRRRLRHQHDDPATT